MPPSRQSTKRRSFHGPKPAQSDHRITSASPLTSPRSKPPASSRKQKQKSKPNHIPRPPNAFITFRSFLWAREKDSLQEHDLCRFSVVAADRWRQMSAAEKAPFQSMAQEHKRRHEEMYPGYKYSPGRSQVIVSPASRAPDNDNGTIPSSASLPHSPSPAQEETPVFDPDATPELVESEVGFVRTSDIPYLDLSALPEFDIYSPFLSSGFDIPSPPPYESWTSIEGAFDGGSWDVPPSTCPYDSNSSDIPFAISPLYPPSMLDLESFAREIDEFYGA